ncbi:hypothetical protein ACFL03_04415 [Thermodesulfobacteriota bacterium]
MAENTWVAVGDAANWERGFENGIWGLRPQLENHWNRIRAGDLVLFYCKLPVKGFVGAGILRSKFKQTEPYWKEELQENQVIWPFRFEFDITHLIPLGSWRTHSISNHEYNLPILAGINPVRRIDRALQVLERLQFTQLEPIQPHREVAAKILEIGKIQRMIVEPDFPVDQDILDVIWKRTIRSVPTFAFSVNLENDLDKSIKPLKHAFDLWNSRPFLVTSEDRVAEVDKLVSGLYHEFSSNLKVLHTAQIQDLHDSKKRYYDLEEKYGLR